MSLPSWKNVLDQAECLATRSQVNAAIEKLAAQIASDYYEKNPIILCVMNGGLYITAALTERLDIPLRLDYIHASRYRGETQGKDLQWFKMPAFNLANEHVLVVDDVYDNGITLLEIEKELSKQNPASLKSLVLVNKLHQYKPPGFQVTYVGMELDNKYLFGCGMDYYGHWRHLPQIFAINE